MSDPLTDTRTGAVPGVGVFTAGCHRERRQRFTNPWPAVPPSTRRRAPPPKVSVRAAAACRPVRCRSVRRFRVTTSCPPAREPGGADRAQINSDRVTSSVMNDAATLDLHDFGGVHVVDPGQPGASRIPAARSDVSDSHARGAPGRRPACPDNDADLRLRLEVDGEAVVDEGSKALLAYHRPAPNHVQVSRTPPPSSHRST